MDPHPVTAAAGAGAGVGAAAEARDVVVPARQARAVGLRSGQRLRVTDIEGQQVGDLFAFPADPALGTCLSAAHTRACVDRLFPRPGEAFFTELREPLLVLEEDDSPGRHDMLIPACDARRYAALGAPPGHPSCAGNLRTALSAVGHPVPVAVPQPVNLFMDIRVEPDGHLAWFSATTRPGASIAFRAVADCTVVVSACPQELSVVNNGTPTPLALSVL